MVLCCIITFTVNECQGNLFEKIEERRPKETNGMIKMA
jgi:hypothetical protein